MDRYHWGGWSSGHRLTLKGLEGEVLGLNPVMESAWKKNFILLAHAH